MPNLRVVELDFGVESLFHCILKTDAGFVPRGSLLPNIKDFTLRCSLFALRR